MMVGIHCCISRQVFLYVVLRFPVVFEIMLLYPVLVESDFVSTTYTTTTKNWTVEIAQLWQHNRGNYTTPTIYPVTPLGTKVLLIVNRTF